jgi:hypothetical protein
MCAALVAFSSLQLLVACFLDIPIRMEEALFWSRFGLCFWFVCFLSPPFCHFEFARQCDVFDGLAFLYDTTVYGDFLRYTTRLPFLFSSYRMRPLCGHGIHT